MKAAGFGLTILLSLFLSSFVSRAQENSSLLFHLSGERGATADYAKGSPEPNYLAGVSLVEDGAVGKGFHAAYRQLMAYKAPGNIYADRGTLAFYWRSEEPFTETEFPIFRVSFADHTSWDMVWLRIDFNGSGIEGFVTDNNLVRVRVKKELRQLPRPEEWMHIALSWDESKGVRLYLNGELAARRDTVLTLNTGLDQFGPHSRIISPYQVQSAYNMQRGGGIDEIRIYDRMLSDEEVKRLATRESKLEEPLRHSADGLAAWRRYMGFDGELPPYLEHAETAVRKIGTNEVYDVRRWYWKSNDGIRETTWPGVYNLSRIEGRTDYFKLPDWDCYSTSGKQLRIDLPDEDWNFVQVTGGAYGSMEAGNEKIGSKACGTQRSYLMLREARHGETLTFTNDIQETPIQELDVFNVQAGKAPEGIWRLRYIVGAWDNCDNPMLTEVEDFVAGRFHEGGRSMLLAMPARANAGHRAPGTASDGMKLPVAHIVIPGDFRDIDINRKLHLDESEVQPDEFAISWNSSVRSYSWVGMHAGLDGMRIKIPALRMKAFKDGLIPLNIEVKDPIWKLRNMFDFSFSVKPGEERTLWLDLRDRILPDDRPLYISISGAGEDFDADAFMGMEIELVFKPRKDAAKEHVEDRLTQVRDNYAMICEENTSTRKLGKYRQFEADIRDLIKVDPENELARKYWYIYNPEQIEPAYDEPKAPAGVPEWAFVQMEVLKQYREIIEYYIDRRQIENGEFGGGISDDTDLTNWFPALIQLGSIPEKASESLARFFEAIYDQQTLTRGMSTIQTDGLHTYEEGVNTVCQANVAMHGNPKYAERLMESARSVRDWLLGMNSAGHIHFRSDYFSATRIALEGPWAWSSTREYYHTGPALLLGQLYGNQGAKGNMINFALSVLAHAKVDANGRMTLPGETNFITDEVRTWESRYSVPMMWYSWLWTGDKRFLKAVTDSQWMPALPDEQASVAEMRKVLKNMDRRKWIITEGTVWIDRLSLEYASLQTLRMGGICMDRSEHFAPYNLVSWRFPGEYDAEKIGILFTGNSRESFAIRFFNASGRAMKVRMRGEELPAGIWKLEQGVAGKGSNRRNAPVSIEYGRGREVELIIPAGREYVISMNLETESGFDFNANCDLAISGEDVVSAVNADGSTAIEVTVHNIGSLDSKACRVVVLDKRGKVIAESSVPSIMAPNDLIPKTVPVSVIIPSGLKASRLVVNPDGLHGEIYGWNNSVEL